MESARNPGENANRLLDMVIARLAPPVSGMSIRELKDVLWERVAEHGGD